MKQSQGTMSVLDMLEAKARECQDQEDRSGKVTMRVAPEVVLSLIAAARELKIAREAVDSAMERLFRRGDVNDDGDLAQVVKLLCWSKALPSLPEPTNGR